jgi:hypothetical protein
MGISIACVEKRASAEEDGFKPIPYIVKLIPH